ncbi:hypothetical protein Vadar_006847 [Vaccinium darrowii]|uniref:Uncharacterized protein n=1 Tax=Vaccinium darrowii TaxID=229202 RepID=A0ACB7XNQ5_9ERIC|nr:hypothetical protein Vadar_006847 [Vaccinium darrowii]
MEVRPLRSALKRLRSWITGKRKDQSPWTRAEIHAVQVGLVFEGMDKEAVEQSCVVLVEKLARKGVKMGKCNADGEEEAKIGRWSRRLWYW